LAVERALVYDNGRRINDGLSRMSMTLPQIVILALLQGFAELLPVSSSAHVIVAEKLMGLDPSRPEMTLLLLMLHTGTMFSVLVYFWKGWQKQYFQTGSQAWSFAKQVAIASLATAVLGLGLKHLIEKVFLGGTPKAEVEMLFGNLTLVSISLACAGLLILFAASRESGTGGEKNFDAGSSICVGLVQGLCLPFRGFSRSGATISTGLLIGWAKVKAEDFSFALVLVITPPLLLKEVLRLLKAQALNGLTQAQTLSLFVPGIFGMALSFFAGLLALKWLSSWLSHGRWGYFGIYCLAFSGAVWFFLR